MASDKGCICKGNWRKIVAEKESLIGEEFLNASGDKWRLFGIVHGGDDYYYGMVSCETEKIALLSCVGSIEGHGFILFGKHR